MSNLKILSDQSKPLDNFSIEYALVALVFVLLALQKWTRKNLPLVRFRNIEPYDEMDNYNYINLPGPSNLPIIGCFHHMTDIRHAMQMLLDYGNRFGPVLRGSLFYEKFVVLNNAPMAQVLLQSSEMQHLTKSPLLYDPAFKELLNNGLITSKGNEWKTHRKLLSPAFSFQSFQNYTRSFFKYSTKLVHDLDALFQSANGDQEETRQINSTIHMCSLQVMAECVMGLDFCDDKDGLKFYQSLRRVKAIFGERVEKYFLMLEFFWKLHPLSKEFVEHVETIKSISAKMIQKTKIACQKEKTANCSTNDYEMKEYSKGRTMIEEMLRANMSDTDILYEVNTMITAGFETTGSAVQWTLFLLALNPEHKKLCREEIDSIYEDPMKCYNGELTFDAIADMKYIERCVQESLRIFPPIFAIFRRLDKPLRINKNLEIPTGTNVVVPIMGLHLDSNVYPDPERFDPDRFLPEVARQRHPFSYIPFSSGTRKCLGEKFALMEAKIMVAHIIRHFEVYTTDAYGDVNLLPSIFLTPERDYNFKLERRTDIPFEWKAGNNNQI